MPVIGSGLTAFATPEDVAAQWRPLSTQEATTAQVLLDRVSALIRLRYPGTDERMSDESFATVVSGVTVDAVLRVLRNPDGKVQESIDDYTYRRADAVADGVLYLTESEWAAVAPVANVAGVYSVSLGG